MGFSRKRVGKDGQPRYTAYYRDIKDRECSAGTFPNRKDAGVTPVTIRYNKVLLSAIFTTALNDQVVFLHPCRGVKTPTVPQKPRARRSSSAASTRRCLTTR